VLIPFAKLNPDPLNPRKISAQKIEALKQSIRSEGFVEPIVVQLHSKKHGDNVIIGGHQRVRAIREMAEANGEKPPPLPCVVLAIDDRRARLLNLALNNAGGEFDDDLLGQFLSALEEEDPLGVEERLMTGFDDREIKRYLEDDGPSIPVDDETGSFAQSVTLSIAFDSVKERDTVKALLNERAQQENKKPGTIVRELLA
jgi:ParB-like chromosome segregation protein Spo0J